MAEAENIKKVVAIIAKVPPKSLKLIELANEIPLKYGEFDIEILEKRAIEIETAKDEADAYKEATGKAIRNIERLL